MCSYCAAVDVALVLTVVTVTVLIALTVLANPSCMLSVMSTLAVNQVCSTCLSSAFILALCGFVKTDSGSPCSTILPSSITMI